MMPSFLPIIIAYHMQKNNSISELSAYNFSKHMQIANFQKQFESGWQNIHRQTHKNKPALKFRIVRFLQN